MDKLNLNHLEDIVEASVNGWSLFISAGITSTFYQNASAFYQPQDAAKITVMHLYLSTFSPSEKKKLLLDSDYFLGFAYGFMKELLPQGKRDQDFVKASRTVFCKSMKRILSKKESDIPNNISYQNRRDFMRGAMSLTSSVDEIIACWDLYKEFMFRFEPLTPNHSGAISNIA